MLILRTVSDVVGGGGSNLYGDTQSFEERNKAIMREHLEALPLWLEHAHEGLLARG